MGRFTTGVIIGGLIGAAGLVGMTMAVTDSRTRNLIAKDSKRAFKRANHMLEDMF